MGIHLDDYHPYRRQSATAAQTAAFFDAVKGAGATVDIHRYLPFPESAFAALRECSLASAGIDAGTVSRDGLSDIAEGTDLAEPFTGVTLGRRALHAFDVYQHTVGKSGAQIVAERFGVAAIQHPEISIGSSLKQYPYLAVVEATGWRTVAPSSPYHIRLCRASEWIAERISTAASKPRRALDRSQQDWAQQHEELFAARLEEILRMPQARSS